MRFSRTYLTEAEDAAEMNSILDDNQMQQYENPKKSGFKSSAAWLQKELEEGKVRKNPNFNFSCYPRWGEGFKNVFRDSLGSQNGLSISNNFLRYALAVKDSKVSQQGISRETSLRILAVAMKAPVGSDGLINVPTLPERYRTNNYTNVDGDWIRNIQSFVTDGKTTSEYKIRKILGVVCEDSSDYISDENMRVSVVKGIIEARSQEDIDAALTSNKSDNPSGKNDQESPNKDQVEAPVEKAGSGSWDKLDADTQDELTKKATDALSRLSNMMGQKISQWWAAVRSYAEDHGDKIEDVDTFLGDFYKEKIQP